MVALISLFKKILHCAAKDFCEAENRFRTGFIDILVVLLVHLDRPEADAASLGKLCLCAAVGRTDALEIGVSAVISNILGLFFAALLTKKLKIRNWGRTALLLPNIMSGVILGYIWQFIFTRAFPALGELLGWGVFQQSWLGTPQTAFWGIAIVSIWQWTGYTMIIYVAGINSISADVQEAAMLDGATGLQKFFRVTLPLIMPSVTICLFWTITRACTMFDLPFALTAGGPFRSSETIAMNIYTEAFTRNNYGLGSAKAMLFFAAVLIVAQLQVFVTSKQEVQA